VEYIDRSWEPERRDEEGKGEGETLTWEVSGVRKEEEESDRGVPCWSGVSVDIDEDFDRDDDLKSDEGVE
jgi:hypothetical protein